MRQLSAERAKFYQNIVETSKAEFKSINAEIEKIVNEARERVGEFERDKEAALMVHAGACRRLGIENEYEQEEDDDQGEGR
jgi:hypothetical protein